MAIEERMISWSELTKGVDRQWLEFLRYFVMQFQADGQTEVAAVNTLQANGIVGDKINLFAEYTNGDPAIARDLINNRGALEEFKNERFPASAA